MQRRTASTALLLVLTLGLLAGCKTRTIWVASRNGNARQVQDLLAKDPTLINAQDLNGWTPVLWATDHGHRKVVVMLLEKGADPTVKASGGYTPLMSARQNGHKKIEELLVEDLAKRGAAPKRY